MTTMRPEDRRRTNEPRPKAPYWTAALAAALPLLLHSHAVGAQDKSAAKPKPATLQVNVLQRTSEDAPPVAFSGVGVFKLLQGDGPFDKGRCPSKSNARGTVLCNLTCNPDDGDEATLLLMPPGADVVVGFETPVASEITLRGCTAEPKEVEFVYTPLQIALAEALTAAPELRRVVLEPKRKIDPKKNVDPAEQGRDDGISFDQLKPFAQIQDDLLAYVDKNPNNPKALRFVRIVRDASVAGGPAIDRQTAQQLREFSVGAQSIYLNDSARRALGEQMAAQVAPITVDPARLRLAASTLQVELARKTTLTPREIALQKELIRFQSRPPSMVADSPAIDWHRLEPAKQFAK